MSAAPKTYPYGRRGFASMSLERRREISRMGGRAAQRMGVAHRWDSKEAALAGSKGGTISRGGRGRRPAVQS